MLAIAVRTVRGHPGLVCRGERGDRPGRRAGVATRPAAGQCPGGLGSRAVRRSRCCCPGERHDHGGARQPVRRHGNGGSAATAARGHRPRHRFQAVGGVRRAVGDLAFPATAVGPGGAILSAPGADRTEGHGSASADLDARRPRRRAPSRPREPGGGGLPAGHGRPCRDRTAAPRRHPGRDTGLSGQRHRGCQGHGRPRPVGAVLHRQRSHRPWPEPRGR